jgi:hypothetical protein
MAETMTSGRTNGRRLHDSRTPHKVFLLIACVLVGGLGLIFRNTQASSIAESFPGNTRFLWYLGILTGGVVSLTGIVVQTTVGHSEPGYVTVIKRIVTGALIEQAGMILLTGIMVAFSFAAFAKTGVPAISGVLILGGLGVANLVRAWQIHQDIMILRRELSSYPHEGTPHE